MTTYRFGSYAVDTDRIEVTGPEGAQTFEPQVFDVLRYLLEQGDRLVTKEELLDNVWGDRFISESAMTTRIKQARRLVGDDGRTQWAIKTVHGRGYRFVAEVIVSDGLNPRPSADAAHPSETPPHPPRPGAAPAALPRELALQSATPSVGRSAEIEEAMAVVARQEHGPTSWVWLLGEPGIGKTHIASRVAQLAFERGGRVLFGRCSEDLAVPYQPIIEALRASTFELSGDALRARLGPLGSELVRLLPDLPARVDGLTPPAAADPETERYRLFEAVMGWLDIISRDHPLVLVIDDAHWATSSTVQLLDRIAASSLATNVTIVVTARDTTPDENQRLVDIITQLERTAANSVIRLGGLDAPAARELLGADADVTAALAQTAGNPLLLQAMDGGDGRVDIGSAVKRRLAGLGESVREALTVAALVGLEFDSKVVAGALDRDELEVIDALDQAVGARVLDEVELDVYRFPHALIRASLRDVLSAGRRVRWHARIGSAIERVHDGPPDTAIAAIAHHYAEASAADPSLRPLAVEHLERAAVRAADQLSFSEAIELFHRARSLADPAEGELLVRLALAQGEAETRAGLNRPAIRSFDAAFVEARAAGRADLVAESAVRYEDASWRPGTFGRPAVDRLLYALAGIDPSDQRARARLLVALIRAFSLTGDLHQSDAAYHEVERLLGSLGDVDLEVRALSAHLSPVRDTAPLPDALGLARRLASLWGRVSDVEVEMLARQVHLRHMARFGLFADYRRFHTEMLARKGQLHSSFWNYLIANHEAMLTLYEGDLAQAEQDANRCADIASQLVDEDNSGTFGLRMFMIRREQDRLGHLAPLIRQLIGSGETASFWSPGLALLLAESGQTDEAAALLTEFKQVNFELPIDAMWSTVMTMFIELAVLLDDVESCGKLYELCAEQSGKVLLTGHGIVCFGAADRYLGMLATTLGDFEAAERHLEAAIDLDGSNGGVLWAGHARLRLARVHRLRGRDADAETLVARVRDDVRGQDYPALERLTKPA